MLERRVTIFLRYPKPGTVKTRLIPALGSEGAARLYRRLAEYTLDAALRSGLPVELRVTGGSADEFTEWLGNGLCICEQGTGDLGLRLARVPAPAIVIGTDAPGIEADLLAHAAQKLETNSVVVGPATDGGYYLIGFNRAMPFLFSGIEWSTSKVFAETMNRLRERRIKSAVLPELSDIDEPEDLLHWPELMND